MDFEYFIKNRKFRLKVLECKSFLSKARGLMFRKKSLPLLFIFNKEKEIRIHSFFCKPFIALWIDKNHKTTKIKKISSWRLNLTGIGKYLLEIPLEEDSDEHPTKK
jgi:uncharacterized membrane protein (UPF0127 family)